MKILKPKDKRVKIGTLILNEMSENMYIVLPNDNSKKVCGYGLYVYNLGSGDGFSYYDGAILDSDLFLHVPED